METRLTSTLALFVLLSATSLSSSDALAEVNRWNGFSSTVFTQGFVRAECPQLPPCQHDDFNIGGDSDAQCPIPAFGDGPTEPLVCVANCFARVDNFLNLDGYAGHFPAPPGDVVTGTGADLRAERVDENLLSVTGLIFTVGIWPGTVEIAVFKYSGDPTVFDGLEIDHIEELVDLGIIQEADILAAETITSGNESVDFQAQVTGLADDEIVLFAAGDGRIPPPVPATGVVGAAVLMLASLSLGTWVLRRWKGRAN